MSMPILCLVAFILVVWVIVLKMENQSLKADNAKLKERLGEHVDRATGGLKAEKGRRLSAGEVMRAEKSTWRHK